MTLNPLDLIPLAKDLILGALGRDKLRINVEKRVSYHLRKQFGDGLVIISVTKVGPSRTTIYHPELFFQTPKGNILFREPERILRTGSWDLFSDKDAQQPIVLNQLDSVTFLFRLAAAEKLVKVVVYDTSRKATRYKRFLTPVRQLKTHVLQTEGDRQFNQAATDVLVSHRRPLYHDEL